MQQVQLSTLNLRVGDMVEVRSKEEILRTLDADGKLEALPFMPEMLLFAGRRFRVSKRADKTCDTIEKPENRRMNSAVHLEDLRCDGAAHGNCQARCLLFWKEAWLKPVEVRSRRPTPSQHRTSAVSTIPPSEQDLSRATSRRIEDGNTAYMCQATELVRATSPLAWWDIRQYIRDVRSGNVRVSDVVQSFIYSLFRQLMAFKYLRGHRFLLNTYNSIQRSRNQCPFPFLDGKVTGQTPGGQLDLKPGETVQVRTHEEILATLNGRSRNRGLRFDPEMAPFCGGTYRVLARVEHIINEQTGVMMQLPNDCIILDGVACKAQYAEKRLFCPRGIYAYWREIWLKRV